MKLAWLLVSFGCALGACSQSTPVSITNRSGKELQSVAISGSGFESTLGSIAPGTTVTTQVRPSGESGLKLSFRSGKHAISLPAQGYFEGGGNYAVRAVVAQDLSVSVNASLRY